MASGGGPPFLPPLFRAQDRLVCGGKKGEQILRARRNAGTSRPRKLGPFPGLFLSYSIRYAAAAGWVCGGASARSAGLAGSPSPSRAAVVRFRFAAAIFSVRSAAAAGTGKRQTRAGAHLWAPTPVKSIAARQNSPRVKARPCAAAGDAGLDPLPSPPIPAYQRGTMSGKFVGHRRRLRMCRLLGKRRLYPLPFTATPDDVPRYRHPRRIGNRTNVFLFLRRQTDLDRAAPAYLTAAEDPASRLRIPGLLLPSYGHRLSRQRTSRLIIGSLCTFAS